MSQPKAVSPPEPVKTTVPASLPTAEIQRLWFATLKKEWSSLVVIPAHPGLSAVPLTKALTEVATLHRGSAVKFLSAEGVDVSGTSRLIVEMTSHVSSGGLVLVALESVLAQPAGMPVALAADAALLCVELGETDAALAKQTVEALGETRFIGAVTVRPRRA
jgi:hypothetical protein